jgi:hypothetical protein
MVSARLFSEDMVSSIPSLNVIYALVIRYPIPFLNGDAETIKKTNKQRFS